MTGTESATGLGRRIDHVVVRLDRLEARVEERFDAVDRRFDAIDRRFETIDQRFEAVDHRFETIDGRFDELRRHFNVVAEASRDDFRNLYDLFRAHMQRMETRMDDLAVNIRAEMNLADAALDSRVTVLERTCQRRRRRTRR